MADFELDNEATNNTDEGYGLDEFDPLDESIGSLPSSMPAHKPTRATKIPSTEQNIKNRFSPLAMRSENFIEEVENEEEEEDDRYGMNEYLNESKSESERADDETQSREAEDAVVNFKLIAPFIIFCTGHYGSNVQSCSLGAA